MANIELITGHAGHGHISGDDWRHLNAGIFGEGTYYLGDAPAVSMANANVLQIANCEIMAQGAHVRITDGPLELAVANGTQGYHRKDLVCIHYEKDSVTGVEDVSFIVVEGDPALTAAGAADPETDYMANSILDGALIVDIPIIRIVLNGITPSAASIIGEATSLAKVRDSLSQIDVKIAGFEVANGTWNGHLPLFKLKYIDGFEQGLMLSDTGLQFIRNFADRTQDKTVKWSN